MIKLTPMLKCCFLTVSTGEAKEYFILKKRFIVDNCTIILIIRMVVIISALYSEIIFCNFVCTEKIFFGIFIKENSRGLMPFP